jgi:hypothetical protein
MTAAERFNIALITTASQGLRPHCSDAGTGDLWISEHPADRAEAALLCAGCPVFDPCGDAAEADPRPGVCGRRGTSAADLAERRQHDQHDHPGPPIRSSQQSTHHMLGDMTTSLVVGVTITTRPSCS